MNFKVTQWAVSRTQEHKKDYLESKLDCDICLLSRCRENHLDMVKQKFENVFYESYSEEYNLVCATKFKPDSIEFIDVQLPSYEYAKSQEGSGAISMTFGDLQTINFATVWDEKNLAVQDLKYFFNNLAIKDKCLVAGDLHEEPTLPQQFHSMFEKYEYDASHTDNLITFSRRKSDRVEGKRHDRIITKGLTVNDLVSHCKPISEGQAHWIIQYSIDSI